jgi:hypothetical protein
MRSRVSAVATARGNDWRKISGLLNITAISVHTLNLSIHGKHLYYETVVKNLIKLKSTKQFVEKSL